MLCKLNGPLAARRAVREFVLVQATQDAVKAEDLLHDVCPEARSRCDMSDVACSDRGPL
jgi:hypothetical protein